MTVVKQIISSLLCVSGTVTVEIKLWFSTSSWLRDANQTVLCWLCKQLIKRGGEKWFLSCFECGNVFLLYFGQLFGVTSPKQHRLTAQEDHFFHTMVLLLSHHLTRCMWTEEHYTHMWTLPKAWPFICWVIKPGLQSTVAGGQGSVQASHVVLHQTGKNPLFTEEFTHTKGLVKNGSHAEIRK